MIIDDRVGLLGSANFDLRCLFVNFEIGVFVYTEPEVLAMRRALELTELHARGEAARRRLLGKSPSLLAVAPCVEDRLPAPGTASSRPSATGFASASARALLIAQSLYSNASRSASQVASMTLSLTPTVPQIVAVAALDQHAGLGVRARLLSRMRTL